MPTLKAAVLYVHLKSVSVAEPGLAFHPLVVHRLASYVDCCLLGNKYDGFGYTLFEACR